MLKAIYINDAKYDMGAMPLFVYNSETGNFENEDSFYHFAIVMNDPDWMVFATNGKTVYPIENKNRAPEEEIHGLVHMGDDDFEEVNNDANEKR